VVRARRTVSRDPLVTITPLAFSRSARHPCGSQGSTGGKGNALTRTYTQGGGELPDRPPTAPRGRCHPPSWFRCVRAGTPAASATATRRSGRGEHWDCRWAELKETGTSGGKGGLGDVHGGHGFRPSGVEGEVRDHLDELGFGEPVLLGEVQVVGQLSVLPPAAAWAGKQHCGSTERRHSSPFGRAPMIQRRGRRCAPSDAPMSCQGVNWLWLRRPTSRSRSARRSSGFVPGSGPSVLR
jgi:hypothetical protein